MKSVIPTLSQAMLVLGILLILAGMVWGIQTRLNAPPEPIFSDAGAVVLAVTAPLPVATNPPLEPSPTIPPPLATPSPTEPPKATESTSASPSDSSVTPTAGLLTSTPTPSPPPPTATPTPIPSPTPLPMADTPPSRIVAPAIDLDAKIVPMGWDIITRNGTIESRWVVPAKAAGWHLNSALPGHGENVVLSGHHNIEGKVFRYLIDLEPGDDITLYAGEYAYTYKVTEKYILKEAGMPLRVRQKNAQWIMPTADERLTLVTCWPYDWPGNSHRLIIVAKPRGWYLDQIGDNQ